MSMSESQEFRAEFKASVHVQRLLADIDAAIDAIDMDGGPHSVDATVNLRRAAKDAVLAIRLGFNTSRTVARSDAPGPAPAPFPKETP